MGNIMQIIRKRAGGKGWSGVVLLLCLLLSVTAEAGVPALASQRVTDVTTRSFAVVWTVSEPSSAVLSLFAADCATPAAGFATALRQNAASGNMRLTVTGLAAATTYCYQLAITSASTSDLTTSAATPVATAAAVVRSVTAGPDIAPTGNDILRVPAPHLPPGETRDAILSTVEMLDGSAAAPLSLLLSSDPNRDYFNLNNIFAAATGKSLDLAGGERVMITENHGTTGCVTQRFRTVPADAGGTAARAFTRANPNDIDASGGVNILDVLRVVAGKGAASTGPCFNSDLDLNGDGVIDGADFTMIKGGFNGLP
jgi:hypothetical protein